MVQILAGRFKGRRLRGPGGARTRPTGSRVREAVFDILGTRVEGSRFLDLYAGTGAVGIEALSRGAGGCLFVESDRSALAVLRANIRNVVPVGEGRVLAMKAEGALRFLLREEACFDILFADPPYAEREFGDLLEGAVESGMLTSGGILMVEHARTTRLGPIGPLGEPREYRYGDTALSLYRAAGEEDR